MSETTAHPKLWKVEDVAAWADVTKDLIYRMARQGKLRGAKKIGSKWRFDPDLVVQSFDVEPVDYTPPPPGPREPPDIRNLEEEDAIDRLDEMLNRTATGR